MTTNQREPEGLWDACSSMESTARTLVADQLKPFENVVRTLYAAGVQAPTLPSERTSEMDMLIAALFLKKALNDFRSAWLLLHLGYTSQAAAVVASLFENSLAVTYIAGQQQSVDDLRSCNEDELPWKIIEMAQGLARKWQAEAQLEGKKFEESDYEASWMRIYAGYKWLCKIKHPTLRSAIHDSSATRIAADEYVIMAAPNVDPNDVTVKAHILVIAINRLREALRSFVMASRADTKNEEYKAFVKRIDEVYEQTKTAYTSIGPAELPIHIGDSWLAKRYTDLLGGKGTSS